MKIRISLFGYLEKLIEGFGGQILEVISKEKAHGKYKVLTALDFTKIPLPIVSAVPKDPILFFGDDLLNPRAAEHKAIMSVKKFLEDIFAVEIHDISYTKIIKCQMNQKKAVSSIESFMHRFSSFLKQYRSAINHLKPILSFASRQHSYLLFEIYKSLSALWNDSHSSILRIDEQLLSLQREMTSYCLSRCTTSNNTIKPRPVVFNISEKDLLSDLLKFVDLTTAEYSIVVIDDDLFRRTCSIYMPSWYNNTPSGRININSEPKAEPEDAECSAAAHAINFLERTRDLELVDFNYDSLRSERQKLDNLHQVHSKCGAMVPITNRSWADFVAALLINHHFEGNASTGPSSRLSSDFATRARCASELEEAFAQIKLMQQNTISSISDPIE